MGQFIKTFESYLDLDKDQTLLKAPDALAVFTRAIREAASSGDIYNYIQNLLDSDVKAKGFSTLKTTLKGLCKKYEKEEIEVEDFKSKVDEAMKKVNNIEDSKHPGKISLYKDWKIKDDK